MSIARCAILPFRWTLATMVQRAGRAHRPEPLTGGGARDARSRLSGGFRTRTRTTAPATVVMEPVPPDLPVRGDASVPRAHDTAAVPQRRRLTSSTGDVR